MKDERRWPVLGTWLKDTNPTPPDPRETARQVAARLPHTRQVRRRWWLPAWIRAPSGLRGSDQTPESPPTAVPATDTHTPTVIGRTQSMFSPAKAITAGALVFAIGGVLLIARPFDQQGSSVPGANMDVVPVWVTGTVQFASDCFDVDSATRDFAARQSDLRCESQTWTSSDSRLGGAATNAYSVNVYVGDRASETYSVYSGAWNILGDGGGWRCANPDGLLPGEGIFRIGIGFQSDVRLTCSGYGDNAGLSAVLKADWSTGSDRTGSATFEGIIFPGEVPPVPDVPPPAAAAE